MNKCEGQILKQFAVNFGSNLVAILEPIKPFLSSNRLSGLNKFTIGVEEAVALSVEHVAQFHVSCFLALGEAAASGSCRSGDQRTTPEAVPERLASY